MDTNAISLVLPLKSTGVPKLRLASCFSLEYRSRLCEAMLMDVLSAARACKYIDDIWLLTTNEALAQQHQLNYLHDIAEDLNGAVQHAATTLVSQGVAHMLVLHADLPLLLATELDSFIHDHRMLHANHLSAQQISIAPDRCQQGSNAVLCSPPDALRFAYGPHSLSAHLSWAEQNGVQSTVSKYGSLATDIDTEDDLGYLQNYLATHIDAAPATRACLADCDQQYIKKHKP